MGNHLLGGVGGLRPYLCMNKKNGVVERREEAEAVEVEEEEERGSGEEERDDELHGVGCDG